MTSANVDRSDGNLDDLSVLVTFELPFSLYLPDGEYTVQLPTLEVIIVLERLANAQVDPRWGVEKSEGVEFMRDRYGRLRYTKVTVRTAGRPLIEDELLRRVKTGELEAPDGMLSVQIMSEEISSDFEPAAFQTAILAVNQLIDVYRTTGDQFHIKRVSDEDIFEATINWFVSDEPLGGTQRMGLGRGLTLEPTLSPMTVANIRHWLQHPRPVPVFALLFADSKEKLDAGDYRSAVIDARTALEVLVDEVLLIHFAHNHADLSAVCQILDVQAKRVTSAEDALRRAEVNRKLGNGLKKAIGLDLHNDSELWTRWLSAKQARETGAHRGASLTKEEASAAVNSMGDVIDKVLEAAKSSMAETEKSSEPAST